MKKMYAGILILALMLCAAVYNVHYLDAKMELLLQYVDTAQELAERGENDSAADILSEAISYWDGMDSYTHVFIRHSEIDSAFDAFYDCLGSLQSGDEGCGAALDKLRAHLLGIATMEHFGLGSIF